MLVQDLMSFGNRVKHRFPAPLRKVGVFLLRPLGRRLEEKQLALHYSRLLSRGDLAFDVGAHTGTMTTAMLRAGARVTAIEPLPACVKVLKEKFEGRSDVVLEAVGIADVESTMKFSVCDKPQGSTFVQDVMHERDPDLKWSETIDVPVTTLDRLIEKHGVPRFCKIDVEGFELRVLAGLRRPLPFICFEFHGTRLEDARLCAKRLEEIGDARYQVSLYMRHRFQFPDWVSREEMFSFLESHPDPKLNGDIYVRMPGADETSAGRTSRRHDA